MIEAPERDTVKVGRLNKLLSRIAEHSPELATTLTLSVIALGGGHLLLNPANVDASSYGDQDRAITQVAPDYGKNEMNAILSSMGGNGLDQVGTGDGGAGGPNPEGTPVAQITLRLTTEGLNIRSLNDLTATDIGDVLNGEQVTFNFAQTSSNGDVWWNITDKGVTGWIAKNVGGTTYITNDTPVATPEAVGAPLAPTESANATATAEAPLQITVILPDGSNVTATATPSPEVPDANTPPSTIRVYETPDGTTKFYLTRGDRIDSPRFRKVGDGLVEDLHIGRQTVESKNAERLDQFFSEYPSAEWSTEFMDYVVTVSGEERIWRSGEFVTVQDQIVLEFPDGKTTTVTIEMNGERMSERTVGDQIADAHSVFEEWESEEIKKWIEQNRPDLIGEHIIFTFVPTSEGLQPYLFNDLNGSNVLQFAMRADGIGRTSLRTIYFRGAESWFPGDKNARDFGITYAFLFGLVTPGSSNWNRDLDYLKELLNMSYGEPIPTINTLFSTSGE